MEENKHILQSKKLQAVYDKRVRFETSKVSSAFESFRPSAVMSGCYCGNGGEVLGVPWEV